MTAKTPLSIIQRLFIWNCVRGPFQRQKIWCFKKSFTLAPLIPLDFFWLPSSAEFSPPFHKQALVTMTTCYICGFLLQFNIWVTIRKPVIATKKRCLRRYQRKAIRWEVSTASSHLPPLALRYGLRPFPFGGIPPFTHTYLPLYLAALVPLWSTYVLWKGWDTSNREGRQPSVTFIWAAFFSCHCIDLIKMIDTLKLCIASCSSVLGSLGASVASSWF